MTTNAQWKVRRARVKSGEIPHEAIPHGLGGYRNYGCPCSVCTEVGRADNRSATQRRRAAREALGHVPPYVLWSASDDELARRPGLTAAQVAELTGRTVYAVHLRRARLRRKDRAK